MNVTFCQSLGAKDLSGATLLTMASAPGGRRGNPRRNMVSRNCNERKKSFWCSDDFCGKGKSDEGREKKKRGFHILSFIWLLLPQHSSLSVFLTMSCRRARLCIRVKGSPLVGWSVVLSSKMLVLVLSLVLYVFWFTFEGCRVELNIIKSDLVGSHSLSTGSLCLSVSLRVCPSVCLWVYGCVCLSWYKLNKRPNVICND